MDQSIIFLPFSAAVVYWLIALVVLLFLSAMISGSETAFFALSPAAIAQIESQRNKANNLIIKLLNSSEQLLSTILISNNLVNIAAVLVANNIIDLVVEFNEAPMMEYAIKTVALTFFLLLFGEVMPKLLANYRPMGFARRMASPIWMLSKVFRPLSWGLIKIGGAVTSRIQHQSVSLGQLQDALEITSTDSVEDKRMLSGIARFSTTAAVEISIPRVDVVTIEDDMPYGEVIQRVVNSGFSRIPVHKENFDNVVGILYIKDLLQHIDRGDDFKWQELLRKPYFVPEHKKIDDLLAEFKIRKMHMAIVVDEYGGTLGIVTLEDILEEIVGDITDDSDTKSDLYQQLSPGVYLFEGRTHIGDLLKYLNLSGSHFDAIKGDSDTIAGLMLEAKGDFLTTGERLEICGVKFMAQQIDGRRITKVRVEFESALMEG